MKNKIGWVVIGFATCLSLSDCHRPPHKYEVDAQLQWYVDQFYTQAASHNRIIIPQTSVKFGILPGDTVGQCYMGYPRLVLIDKDKWQYLGEPRRIAAIFHELGHCLLNREHNEEMVSFGPKSVMFPELLDDVTFATHYDYYVQELFSGR